MLIRVTRYERSAIFLHPNPEDEFETLKLIDEVRKISGDTFFVLLHGDATYSIPDGEYRVDFSMSLVDEPEVVHRNEENTFRSALQRAERLGEHGGLDGFALCADYCFNSGPFLCPNQFGEFVTPYMAKLTHSYRDMGFYVIEHTDGNIMPILDQLAQTEPHALHSLDAQGGVDIAEVKRLYGDRM